MKGQVHSAYSQTKDMGRNAMRQSIPFSIGTDFLEFKIASYYPAQVFSYRICLNKKRENDEQIVCVYKCIISGLENYS